MAEPEAEVPPGLRLADGVQRAARLAAAPALRPQYWIRARVVDLAGNSLAPNPKDFGPESPSKNARTYFRYDPISAPAITLMKQKDGTLEAPAEGESMELMAVRTFNDTPPQNTIPATQHARRVAVPSRTTQREAEQHGLLDRDGLVDPSFFAMLAAKDNSLPQELIETKGPLAEHSRCRRDHICRVARRRPASLSPRAARGRPWRRGSSITRTSRGHEIIDIPLYPDGATWPDARAVHDPRVRDARASCRPSTRQAHALHPAAEGDTRAVRLASSRRRTRAACWASGTG